MSIGFACRCGAVEIDMPGCAPRHGSHLICYCKDCRAFARHLGADDMLLDHGGNRIFQTRPDWVRVVKGKEHLRALRLSPKGLVRWYAGCCSTPMFATGGRPKVPFIGFAGGAAMDVGALGPEIALGFTASALDPPTGMKDRGLAKLGWRFAKRTLPGMVTGAAKRNPFFEGDRPIAKPELISKEARAAATV
ncbi:MAG: DUF6151 family protein [Pseudomonadota bacterium]